MLTKEAILSKLSIIEKEIAELRRQIEWEWNIPKDQKKRYQTSLWGQFPELQSLTDEEIEEAENIWEKHLEKTINEL
ncbi:hypothetical protein FJZ31_24755 [Candidatus Poribacteria bacterium]|nr:hypothetical protein [Candidatus Poribacteria bacterium]